MEHWCSWRNVLDDSGTHTLLDTWWSESGLGSSRGQTIGPLIFPGRIEFSLRSKKLNQPVMTSADLRTPGVVSTIARLQPVSFSGNVCSVIILTGAARLLSFFLNKEHFNSSEL